MSVIQLIVGLGNPGREYADTRHNAGAWFVEALARRHASELTPDKRAFGLTGRFDLGGNDVRLLIPTTYMNRSGQAVAAVAGFYRIPVESVLVAHDELDIPVGTARFKRGGGHGGHNGLRDTISALGNNRDFHRLRIGIGHPGSPERVTPYLLREKPSQQERERIDAAIDEAIRCLPDAVAGDWPRAMTRLHSFTQE